MASPFEKNLPTREAAFLHVRERLRASAGEGERVLVGWDFPLGYPDGFARALSLRRAARLWDSIGRLLRDGPDNRNNRFEVAARLNARAGAALFWGRPSSHDESIPAKRPLATLPEFRLCERLLRARGLRPQSPWKLYAPGSCGSQALTGIPRVLALRRDPVLRRRSRIWPFETGFVLPRRRPFVLHAECWPGLVAVDRALHPVKDAAQMLSVARWAEREDAAGRLRPLFEAPRALSRRSVAIARREGWVLGIG